MEGDEHLDGHVVSDGDSVVPEFFGMARLLPNDSLDHELNSDMKLSDHLFT